MALSEHKNKIIGGIVGAIAFGLASFAVKHYFFKKPTFDKVLANAAIDLNKTCPIMIDNETRLDNAVAVSSHYLQYNYTLVNLSVEEIDTIQAHKIIDSTIINDVKTKPELHMYRDHQVTMAYCYKDKDGKYMMRLDVTPELYK